MDIYYVWDDSCFPMFVVCANESGMVTCTRTANGFKVNTYRNDWRMVRRNELYKFEEYPAMYHKVMLTLCNIVDIES